MRRLLALDIVYSVIFWLILGCGLVLARRGGRLRTVGAIMIGGMAILSVLVLTLVHFGWLEPLLQSN
jgi:hypothetical protein